MKNMFSNSQFICISPELNFLKTLADELFYYLKDFKNQFKIAFPHRRAGIYLRYYLSQHELPLLLPQIYSIEDFINEIFVRIDPRPQIHLLDLIHIIYNFVKDKKIFSKINTIDRFLPWGFYIAEAIDEIEMEMIDIRNLNRVHLNALSPFVSEIADLLAEIYHHLELIRKAPEFSFSTKGERFRVVAEHINQVALESKRLILAGFSFLTNSESQIFKSLINRGATLVLEGNVSDLERILGLKPPDESIVEIKPNTCEPKKVNIYKSSNFHHCLMDIEERNLLANKDNRPDENLILLADASKLMGVVSFHPNEIPLNVTMGFPFLSTQLGVFLSTWFKLILNAKEGCVYTQHLISWLNHNYFIRKSDKNIQFLNPREYIRDLEEILRNLAPKYVSKDLILQILERSNITDSNKIREFVIWLFDLALIPYISNKLSNVMPYVIIQGIKEFLEQILFVDQEKESVFKKNDLMSQLDEISYYYFLNEIFWPIYKGRFGKALFNSVYSVFNFLYQLMSSVRIPISSKPLVGNQVMGLLETRLLSFERVIILEANEGIVPSFKSPNPIFPEQLKGLLSKNKDTEEQVQRYHFRRLLWASKEVHIYYSDREKEGDAKKGSKSRFLEEIQWEAQKYGTYNVMEEPLKPKKVTVSKPRQEIFKQKEIKDFIKEWLRTTPISASIINTYLKCQIRFFYKYILKLEVPDELSDTTSRDFGSIVHVVLQNFLKRFEGCDPVKLDTNDKMLLMEILDETLLNSNLKIQLDEVRYKMLHKVTQYRLNDFFEILKEKCTNFHVKVLGIETEFKGLEFQNERLDLPIKLSGRYDCIMQINDEYWIFDFKTGASKKISEMVNLQKLIDVETYIGDDKERLHSSFKELCEFVKDFQLLFYAFTYHMSTQVNKLNGSYIYLSATKKEMEQILFKDKFEVDFRNTLISKKVPKVLELVLFHLLNYEYFHQADDKGFCRACRVCR